MPGKSFATKKLSDYSRGELALAILKYVGIGIFVAGVIICPNLAQVYKMFDSKTPRNRERVRRSVRQLQKQKLLGDSESDDSPLKLTAAGMRRIEYENLSIQPTPRWDKKWRLCMFDIPETHKGFRVAFSRKVNELGMMSFQKSVFISPYPCEIELRKAARYLGVEKYIRLVTATTIGEENFIKKSFGV